MGLADIQHLSFSAHGVANPCKILRIRPARVDNFEGVPSVMTFIVGMGTLRAYALFGATEGRDPELLLFLVEIKPRLT